MKKEILTTVVVLGLSSSVMAVPIYCPQSFTCGMVGTQCISSDPTNTIFTLTANTGNAGYNMFGGAQANNGGVSICYYSHAETPAISYAYNHDVPLDADLSISGNLWQSSGLNQYKCKQGTTYPLYGTSCPWIVSSIL